MTKHERNLTGEPTAPTRIPMREVCRRTGLRPRHWQMRCTAGEVPGVIRYGRGERRVYLFDEAIFMAWWAKQGIACPIAISGNGAASTGSASDGKAKRTKARSKRKTRPSRAKELRANWQS